MKNQVKRVFLGVGLLVHMSFCAMSSMQKNKIICWSEKTKLYQLVTAEWLDTEQLLSNKRLFWSINDKDRHGCTPLHHLMMHKDATVDLVKLFIKHGAQLDITNNKGEDPYLYGIKNHHLFHCLQGDECLYNENMINFVHSEMLAKKLWALCNSQYPQQQCSQKRTSKKSTFYVIR